MTRRQRKAARKIEARQSVSPIAPETLSLATGTALYVAYGMNTNTRQMAMRCPNAKDLGICRLPGHRLVFRGVADVVPMRSRAVECVLWEITPSDEAALDRLEGYPNTYGKKRVTVIDANNNKVEAFIYEMTGKRRATPSPAFPPYYNMLDEGYAEHGIDPQQLELAQMEATGIEAHERRRRRLAWDDQLVYLNDHGFIDDAAFAQIEDDGLGDPDLDELGECNACGIPTDDRILRETGGFCLDDAPMTIAAGR